MTVQKGTARTIVQKKTARAIRNIQHMKMAGENERYVWKQRGGGSFMFLENPRIVAIRHSETIDVVASLSLFMRGTEFES